MPTLRVPVGGNGHRSIQRPIQTRSDGRCPDVRKKISQSVSHKSEPHPFSLTADRYVAGTCLSPSRIGRGRIIGHQAAQEVRILGRLATPVGECPVDIAGRCAPGNGVLVELREDIGGIVAGQLAATDLFQPVGEGKRPVRRPEGAVRAHGEHVARAVIDHLIAEETLPLFIQAQIPARHTLADLAAELPQRRQ